MVDAKKRLERVLADAGQESAQVLFGNDRRIVGTADRIGLAPAADDFEHNPSAVPESAAHAQPFIRMDKIVGRQMREAEKEVRERPHGRRFASLVRPVDKVQAMITRREIERHTRERADSLEIKADEL